MGRCIVRPVRQEVDRHGVLDKLAMIPDSSSGQPGRSNPERVVCLGNAKDCLSSRGGADESAQSRNELVIASAAKRSRLVAAEGFWIASLRSQ
jgi:hypothetical protein